MQIPLSALIIATTVRAMPFPTAAMNIGAKRGVHAAHVHLIRFEALTTDAE
jgi:hypothetical protein